MRFAAPTWLNSLSVRVLLAYVAGAALSTVPFVLVAVAVANSQGKVLSGMQVAERAKDLASMLVYDRQGVPVGFDESEGDLASWLSDSLKTDTAYRVLDTSGKVVLSSAAGEAFWPANGAGLRLQRGRFEFEREGVSMRAATEPVDHGGRTWFLQFAASTRFLDRMFRGFALPFTGAGIALFSLILLFAFGACAYVTLRYTLKPLRRVSEAAAAISPRSLHARLETGAVPVEVAPLVHSFNRVLERLEQGYRTQQEFLGTAAHELKTPLALIQAQIELMADGDDRKSLLGDVEHMTRHVQQLLLLAEASERQNYGFATVDAREVAREAASFLQRLSLAAEVAVVTPDDGSDARWLADRGALFTLFKNMLENAIQHAPRGSEVRVEVGAAGASVRDWGPGVTEEELPKLFARFWRGAHRRDRGAGLGLAICQEIALAHGWTLSAQRAEPGLRLCLSLPRPR